MNKSSINRILACIGGGSVLGLLITNEWYRHKIKKLDEDIARIDKENEQLSEIAEAMHEVNLGWEKLLKKESMTPEEEFNASVEHARSCGVPEELILHDDEEASKFFTS